MQISCPSCDVSYQVPEAKMAGKRLRCSACGHVWMPIPKEPPPPVRQAPEPPPRPVPQNTYEPIEAEAPPAPPPAPLVKTSVPAARRRVPWVLIGWAATILFWGGAALAVIDCRAQITRNWPPSIRLYHLLGLSTGQAHDTTAQDRGPNGPAAQHQH